MANSGIGSIQDAEFRQAMLAAIVESSDDAIVSKTLEGIITSWNASAKRLFGYDESEIIGRHISILLPLERLSEEEVIIKEIIKGNRIDHFQTRRKRKDGTELDISLTISPVRNKNNEIIGASKIARDISHQVATEAKLMAANLELQKLNLYKDDFIGLLGHELRTPLAGIKACIQLMAEVPARTPELLVKADRQVNRMTTLLVELVDFAKSQAGRLDVVKTQTVAQDFIVNGIETVQQGQSTHQIEFMSEIPPVTVMADPLRMEQVVINLLTNAVKYSPGSDSIVVSLEQTATAIIISVKDSGLGIPHADLDKIWNRFYRVPDHKAKIKGLGIGLHLCKQIVDLHGGKIWAESDPGRGSTFFFKLPLGTGY